jgi:hypothetical protein
MFHFSWRRLLEKQKGSLYLTNLNSSRSSKRDWMSIFPPKLEVRGICSLCFAFQDPGPIVERTNLNLNLNGIQFVARTWRILYEYLSRTFRIVS